ncbi:hypothetical protein ACVW00_000904 [Marmoricola sp. URHA0025 HA25]
MREGLPVLGSVGELLAGAEGRTLLDTNGKSGARLEAVTIGGERHVVKHLDDGDWSTRASGFPGGAVVELWRRGILDRLPDCFNQPIVAVSGGEAPALLMRDVSAWLVPDVDAAVPAEQQDRFLVHMATLHAAFWETTEPIDLVDAEHRYLELSPAMAEEEARRGSDHPIPKLVARGWPLLAEVAPKAAAIVTPLAHDPGPLVRALATTPQTLVHGNWKFDNLGTDDRGRTVLIDWELPGRAAPLSDLAWYLAINCRRLPTSKEAVIEAYRAALERQGVDTEPWWDRQLALALVGALVQFGWEKAFGGYDEELAWWEARVVAGEAMLSA